jgi:phosphoglycolate phosphatase-like HAD superfamily hydrolase
MEMAVRAGVAGWGAAWGLHGREELLAAGAVRCFESPAEVAAALAGAAAGAVL